MRYFSTPAGDTAGSAPAATDAPMTSPDAAGAEIHTGAA